MFSFDAFKSEYKKNLKKNFAFLKNQKGGITALVLFTVIFTITLTAFAYYLMINRLISEEFFFGSTVVFLGWLFALQLNLIHMRQNREDDSIARNNDIIKRLKVEAFKEVNKTVGNAGKVLAKIENCYFHICKEVEEKDLNAVDSLLPLLTQLEDKYNKMNQTTMGLPGLWQKINLNFRAHEIILGEFDKLLSNIENEFKTSISLTIEFEKHLSSTLKKEKYLSVNDISTLKEECKNIGENLLKIGLLLKDYRSTIMNKMLGPIFE